MSQTIPTTQRAIIADDSGNFVESSNVPVMQLEPDAVIIKVAAVALNCLEGHWGRVQISDQQQLVDVMA